MGLENLRSTATLQLEVCLENTTYQNSISNRYQTVMLRKRRLESEKKIRRLDIGSNSLHMFHCECCMKHSAHVAEGIFYPKVKRHSHFFAYFLMLQL